MFNDGVNLHYTFGYTPQTQLSHKIKYISRYRFFFNIHLWFRFYLTFIHFFLMNASIHSTFVHLLLNIFYIEVEILQSEKILHSLWCKFKGICHCTFAICFTKGIEVDRHVNRALKLQCNLQNYRSVSLQYCKSSYHCAFYVKKSCAHWKKTAPTFQQTSSSWKNCL